MNIITIPKWDLPKKKFYEDIVKKMKHRKRKDK